MALKSFFLNLINKLLSFLPFLAAYKAGKDKERANSRKDTINSLHEADAIRERIHSDDDYADSVRDKYSDRK